MKEKDNLKDIEIKVSNLIKQLDLWNYEYYALANPSVEDSVFDKTMQELIGLEKTYPQFKTSSSPSLRVGGYVSDKFNKIKHTLPMLSLGNAFDNYEINKFCNDVYKEANDEVNFVVEPKIDGLSISLIYENSKLTKAVTRGDGTVGEDVTTNVLTIKNIPLYISDQYKHMQIEIRGEIYISNEDFNELNKDLVKPFSNPRNAAAGSIRNLDSGITASRNLKSFFYYIPNAKQMGLQTQFECIEWLKKNNFSVSSLITCVPDSEAVINQVEHITMIRNELPFEIDGIVIKLNQIKYYDNLGSTSKFPKWAIAYKFPANIVSSKLLSIESTVGRTGKIGYIAHIEPISLDGSIIQAASLHNYDFIKKKNIKINAYIKLCKAGDVIPYVLDVDNEKVVDDAYIYPIPTNCPSCGMQLVTSDELVDQFCRNPNCEEKILRQIEYFVSRDIMNIEGMSYSVIEKLYKIKVIKNEWDLFELHNYHDEIITADINLKQKSFNNFIRAIDKAKNNSLERIIAALTIKGIGYNTSKLLAKKYKTIDNLVSITYENLMENKVVGDKAAIEITTFFSNPTNIELINRIKSLGINTSYLTEELDNKDRMLEVAQQPENLKYHNSVFVISGSFSISRNLIVTILEDIYNCKITNTVTKKTNFLLLGVDGGSKEKKAQDLKIPIISNEFWN